MDMKVNKVDNANATVSAKISSASVEGKIDGIIAKNKNSFSIQGFRKGKVPTSVIKARYKDQLKDDARREAIKELVDKALAELSITAEKLIGEPMFTKFEEGEGGSLEIEVKLAITPEIDLGSVDSCVPDFKEPKITDKEVEARIEELATAQAPLEELKRARALKKEDYAIIDFEGFMDGKSVENTKGENYTLKIGSNSFIPGFEDQLIGMKKGEEREIKVTFPEDYRQESLAGKEVEFKVKLHNIQVKNTPELNDELAKNILKNEKDATLELLKEKVKEQLQNEKTSELYNNELKPKILEAFVEKMNFDLPEFVVEQEMDMAFRNALQTFTKEDIEALQKDPEKAKEKRKEYKDDAVKSVKVTFIVDALAKKEGINVSDNELIQTIYYEAMNMGRDPKQTLEFYKNQGLLPAIKMSMIEDRLLSHLLDKKIKG